MEIKEFAQKVQKAIADKVGDEYRVQVQEVQKNNNVILQGLVIHSDIRNVSPTIYLNSFWEIYEQGVPFCIIIERIMQIYESDTPGRNVDMSFFKEFDMVKDRICYRLVSAEQNRDLLLKIPHIEYLDLAICFYYAYQGEELGNGSILIYNSHMDMWQTTMEQLFDLAKENTPRLFPWECNSMESVLGEMMPKLEDDELGGPCDCMSLQVLSNQCMIYGASCILYPGLMQQLADREESNLYIIPSSIHEVIVLPESKWEDKERLQQMILEVNSTHVEPEEILSDSLYSFNRIFGQMKIV